jgi:tRNA/rRNA methyltransferase
MQDRKNLPVIILNRPQMGENVGFAARSMKNFGFSEMRLINPGLMEEDQWEAASNNAAFDLIEFIGRAAGVAKAGADIVREAKIYSTFFDAVHDIDKVYALSARRRDMEKPVITPSSFVKEISETNEKIGLLFGGEASGLSNQDIANSYKIIEIETDSSCKSINLGISVAIMCHTLFSSVNEEYFASRERGISNLASPKDVEFLMNMLGKKRIISKYRKRKRP